MTPSHAIETLPELMKQLNALRAHLVDEADEIDEQWGMVTAIGGSRADHAASLLGRLRPHLRHDPVGIDQPVVTYHSGYGSASGVARLHTMQANVKYG